MLRPSALSSIRKLPAGQIPVKPYDVASVSKFSNVELRRRGPVVLSSQQVELHRLSITVQSSVQSLR